MDVQRTLAQAERLALAGDLAGAEALCHDVLRGHPEHAEALYLLGMFQSHAGNSEAAVALLERAVAANPQFEMAHASLGAILLTLGRVDAAIESLYAAVGLDPTFAEAYETLAGALTRAGRKGAALQAWHRFSKLRADDGDALNRLAVGLYQLGQPKDAADVWASAVRLLPDRADIHTNHALALYQLGRTRDGLAAAERAAQLDPNFVEAQHAIFQGLTTQRRIEEALAVMDRLIASKPEHAQAHYDRGITLLRLGELDACDAALQTAVRLKPESAAYASTRLLVRNYMPGYDVDALYREHVAWAKQYAHASDRPRTENHPNDCNPHRPPRVGFVSSDFRSHPVTDFLRAPFAHHDRDRYEFFAYSDVLVPDQVTAEFQRFATTWRPILGQSDDDVARLIREDKIDILVDLIAHSTQHRLLVFAQRPAPVQLSYIGYCNTTGLAEIDYIIGDAVTDPPGAHQPYAETLLHLPATFACYTPPAAAPPVNALPALARAGGGGITFGSLHGLPKLNDDVIALWSRVLHATPRSRLLLYRDAMTARPRQRLTDAFARHGIDASRLEFRRDLPPGGDPLSVYHDIDISLDTFPWSGHTTACESMWMGVPMVTLPGPTHAGRMAASAIIHAGQPQWVADDADGFVSIAAELARDPEALARVRQTLREQMKTSRLCDAKTFAREFEGLLRGAWKTWCERDR